MKQSCSARGVCWDTASMESANGVLKTECFYNKFVKSKFKKRQILSLARALRLTHQWAFGLHEPRVLAFVFLSSFAGIVLLPKLRKTCGLKTRSVPGSCFKIVTPMNNLVCTSREFWHLFFTFVCCNCTFAKTQENVWFENKVCPWLVVLNLAH